MPSEIGEEKKAEIVKLRATDYTKQEIAEEVGVSRSTVTRHLKEFREEVEESEEPDKEVFNKVATAALGAGAGIAAAKILKDFFGDDD